MANGTSRNRKQILGLKRKDKSVRIGEGEFQNDLVTDKSTQTGTNRFLGGQSTLEFEQRDTVSPDVKRRFRESPEFFAGEDIEKPTSQLFEERKRKQQVSDVGVKPVGTRRPTTFAQKAVEQGDVSAGRDLNKLKRGESIGNFAIGRETAAEEAERKFGVKRGGKPSVFSEQGIRELFGSAADLAKVFASPEFQERKARGIQAAAGRKGRQADIKARNEKIKTLGDLRQSLIESGEEEGSTMLQKIDAQLQSVIQGSSGSDVSQKIGVLGQLLKLGPLTDEQQQLFTGA
jgi:hypothetical protein